MALRYLIQKEFIQIRRNKFLPRLIVVFPIVIMCVMPWVMNQEVKNVVVEVVDNDHSPLSRQLVQQVEQSGYFVSAGQRDRYEQALQDVEKSKADIILVIPPHYSRNMTLGRHPEVLIAANAVNGVKGQMGSAYLSRIVASLSQSVGGAQVAVQSLQQGAGNSVNTLFLYNKHQSYKRFMIPALFAIVLMLMCGFLPALNIVGEKEAGTIEQMNVTPVSKWAFILSKLIPYWIIALFVISVCLLLAWLVYGISCQGPLLLVYVLAMLLALFFSSFGLVVSNYSDTMQQAILVMWFFVVMLLLLSGLFTPTRSMPHWAYLTTYVNPVHYFIDAIRTVFIRGGGVGEIGHQLLALGGITVVMAAWAVRSYKKNA